MKILLIVLLVTLTISISCQRHNYVEYNATGNEFSVTFSGKPKIKSSSAGGIMEFETAELILPDDKSFLFDEELIKQINKSYVFDFISKYANYQGLSYPEIHYEKTKLGKIGTVRGYKELKDGDQLRVVTYFAKVIYGQRSGIILYVGCPSENYPTPEISKFLHSIKKGN